MNSEQHSKQAGPITRRLIYALVLIPIVPAVSIIGATAIVESFGTSSPLDGFRWFHLFSSTLWFVATIQIWRRAVLWTLGKKWLTAMIGLIPFVQVAWGQPIWSNSGCSDILRVSQHHMSIGVWIWLTIWVWWGWEKLRMSNEMSQATPMIARITPTAKRLAASIGTIPFMCGVFWIVKIALDDVFGLRDPITETFAVSGVVAIVIWLLIWRRAVVWSATVVRRTALAAILCIAMPIFLHFWFESQARGFGDAFLAFLPVIGWGVWMAVTIRMWPTHAGEIAGYESAPQCPSCGYLLIGLRATRCPECGSEPTLDELWNATIGTEV